MNTTAIRFLRLKNQKLSGSRPATVSELASYMVAVQAQDVNMSKWAFGVRVAGSTEADVNKELDSGNLIRSHLLRPTWHIVTADDIYWLAELSKSHIRTAMRSRDNQLGLTGKIFLKCNTAIQKSLEGNRHLTRDELFEEIVRAGVKIVKEQASHIYVHAETDGLICSGRQKAGKTTFALLSERVPENRINYTREEAVSVLGLRYFKGRGPATQEDFAWWSGLPVKDVKTAIENNRTSLISDTIDGRTYWLSDPETPPKPYKGTFLLPAFDEFLICYRDRSAMIPKNINQKTVSDNGIFYPVIVKDGLVTGTWSRTVKKDSILITPKFFPGPSGAPGKIPGKALKDFSGFTGKNVELV